MNNISDEFYVKWHIEDQVLDVVSDHGYRWFEFIDSGEALKEWKGWFDDAFVTVAVFELIDDGPESVHEQGYSHWDILTGHYDCFAEAMRSAGVDIPENKYGKQLFRIWFRRYTDGGWDDEWVAPR